MAEGFVFNRVSHQGYADVSEYELPTGNGYLQNTKVLTGVVVTENDTDNRTEISWNNASWAASGGSIGPVVGAIILDSTITTPVANAIVGYVDFGEAQTQADGGIATIANISFGSTPPSSIRLKSAGIPVSTTNIRKVKAPVILPKTILSALIGVANRLSSVFRSLSRVIEVEVKVGATSTTNANSPILIIINNFRAC